MHRCTTCAFSDEEMSYAEFNCTSCGQNLLQCEWCRNHGANQYQCPECGVQALVPFLGNRIAALPVVDSVFLHLSIRRLRNRQATETSIEDILDTAYEFDGFGLYKRIEPWQRRTELRGLVDRIVDHDPSTVVEIGSGRGGTLYTWCRALSADNILSIDLPGGGYGGGYVESHKTFFSSFDAETEVSCLRRNSHERATRTKVEEILGSESIDFLYIDGDHSYEGVKRDFELYEPLMADDGIVALHDIDHWLNDEPDSPYSVKPFWNELCAEYETEAILADPRSDAYGNGIVYL